MSCMRLLFRWTFIQLLSRIYFIEEQVNVSSFRVSLRESKLVDSQPILSYPDEVDSFPALWNAILVSAQDGNVDFIR